MIDYNQKLSNVRETQVPSQRMSILELLYENIKCQFHAVLILSVSFMLFYEQYLTTTCPDSNLN